MPVNFGFHIGVSLLYVMLNAHAHHTDNQRGPIEYECRDRYFLISLDEAILSSPFRIEAVDATGTYPINDEYAATCGYTYSLFSMDGRITLRASYFSCHTEKKNDDFNFKFTIVSTDQFGRETNYNVAKTCHPPLPWSDREVICEENYMEVMVRRDVPCKASRQTSKKPWDAAPSAAYKSTVSEWRLTFLEDRQEVMMSLSDAKALGYGLEASSDYVVFRSAYQQRHTRVVMVDGIEVVVIQTTVLFRQKWQVKMLDLSAACTINPGQFDDKTWSVFWEIPMVVAPLVYDRYEFESKKVSLGVEGQLLNEDTWKERGYSLDASGPIAKLSIPFGAEGGYRLSFVSNNTYNEFYIIYLYYEHLFMDGALTTRHRMPRACPSPRFSHHPFTIDQTVLEEFVFTVYLGNFPWDVDLVTVKLNAETSLVSEAFQMGYISKIPHTNGTHAYTLKVPFEDSVVLRMYLDEGLLQYSLDINYTLNILPSQDPYYHLVSIKALLKDAFPPDLQAACMEKSILFKMHHPKLKHVWEITIDQYPLTPQLAASRGYTLQNTSQGLTLEVPVFTTGYTYEGITLKQFFGTFEVLSRDAKTLDIQKSTTKRCLFNTDELIVCSADGVMTVVTSLAGAFPPIDPARATLLDKHCKPRETDSSRALFEFMVNTCGTRVLVGDHYLVYQNEIVLHQELAPEWEPAIRRDSRFRLTVQCLYQMNVTNRLFVDKTFRSETPGFGSIKVMDQVESSSKQYGTMHDPTPTIHIPSNQGDAKGSSTALHSPSHNSTPQAGGIEHRLSSIQSTSHPYRVNQSGSHASSNLISLVDNDNVDPSTFDGSSTQHAPAGFHPTLSSYGPALEAIQHVNVHAPSNHGAPQTGGSGPYSQSSIKVSQSGGHQNNIRVTQMSNDEGDDTKHAPNGFHPTPSSYGAIWGTTAQHVSNNTRIDERIDVDVPSHHTAKGSTTTHHYSSHHKVPPAGSTKHTPSSISSIFSPYSVDQNGSHSSSFTAFGADSDNMVPSTYESGGVQHVHKSIQPNQSHYKPIGSHLNKKYLASHVGSEAPGTFGDVGTHHARSGAHPTLNSYGPVQSVVEHGNIHVPNHHGAPQTRSHVPTNHSGYGSSQSGGHQNSIWVTQVSSANVVPIQEDDRTQQAPNNIYPTLSSYAARRSSTTQHMPVHSGTVAVVHVHVPSHHLSAMGSLTQPGSSHYEASKERITQDKPSSIHPISGPYGVNQSANTVPRTFSDSDGQSVPNSVKLNVNRYRPVQDTTTQHVSANSEAVDGDAVHSSSHHEPRQSVHTHGPSSVSGRYEVAGSRHSTDNSVYGVPQRKDHQDTIWLSRLSRKNRFPSHHEGINAKYVPNGVELNNARYDTTQGSTTQMFSVNNEDSKSVDVHVSSHIGLPKGGNTPTGSQPPLRNHKALQGGTTQHMSVNSGTFESINMHHATSYNEIAEVSSTAQHDSGHYEAPEAGSNGATKQIGGIRSELQNQNHIWDYQVSGSNGFSRHPKGSSTKNVLTSDQPALSRNHPTIFQPH